SGSDPVSENRGQTLFLINRGQTPFFGENRLRSNDRVQSQAVFLFRRREWQTPVATVGKNRALTPIFLQAVDVAVPRLRQQEREDEHAERRDDHRIPEAEVDVAG